MIVSCTELENHWSKVSTFLEEASRVVEDCDNRIEELESMHIEACDFFLFEKNDEKRDSTMKFFKFFKEEIFEQIQKALPKEKMKNPVCSGIRSQSMLEVRESGGARGRKAATVTDQKPTKRDA